MTSDGVNSYSYDAENRLLSIVYPGSGNHSDFTYDGLGRNVKILEYTSSSLTSTKQFVWCGDKMCNSSPCEARDASSTITAQYFPHGETLSGTGYCFTADHLANPTDFASRFIQFRGRTGIIFSPLFTSSIREMTNSSGTVEAQLAYDMYGRAAQLQGSLAPDFQFGDYYLHSRSGLSLTLTRAYSASQGRFINRDTIAEAGGVNLYEYVRNHPEQGVDPSGKCAFAIPEGTQALAYGLQGLAGLWAMANSNNNVIIGPWPGSGSTVTIGPWPGSSTTGNGDPLRECILDCIVKTRPPCHRKFRDKCIEDCWELFG